MKQEDRELLLKDLCTRLPYGVKVAFFNEDLTYHSEPKTLTGIECINNLNYSSLEDEDGNTTIVEFVKPYLFPLSSMTVEQNDSWRNTWFPDLMTSTDVNYPESEKYLAVSHAKSLDWIYKNHLDIYGLIPMGLAIDATGLNIY